MPRTTRKPSPSASSISVRRRGRSETSRPLGTPLEYPEQPPASRIEAKKLQKLCDDIESVGASWRALIAQGHDGEMDTLSRMRKLWLKHANEDGTASLLDNQTSADCARFVNDLLISSLHSRAAGHVRMLGKGRWQLTPMALYSIFGDSIKSERFTAALRDLEDQVEDFGEALKLLKAWQRKRRSGKIAHPGVGPENTWTVWEAQQSILEHGVVEADRNRRKGVRKLKIGEKADTKSGKSHGSAKDDTPPEEGIFNEDTSPDSDAEDQCCQTQQHGQTEGDLTGVDVAHKTAPQTRPGLDGDDEWLGSEDMELVTPYWRMKDVRASPAPMQSHDSDSELTEFESNASDSSPASPEAGRRGDGARRTDPDPPSPLPATFGPSTDQYQRHDHDRPRRSLTPQDTPTPLSQHPLKRYPSSASSLPPLTFGGEDGEDPWQQRDPSDLEPSPSTPPSAPQQPSSKTHWPMLPPQEDQIADMPPKRPASQPPQLEERRQKQRRGTPARDLLRAWFAALPGAKHDEEIAAADPATTHGHTILPVSLDASSLDQEGGACKLLAIQPSESSAWWTAFLHSESGRIILFSPSEAEAPHGLADALRSRYAPGATEDPPSTKVIFEGWSLDDADSHALVAHHAFNCAFASDDFFAPHAAPLHHRFVPDLWHAILKSCDSASGRATAYTFRQPLPPPIPDSFATLAESSVAQLNSLNSKAEQLARWKREATRVRNKLPEEQDEPDTEMIAKLERRVKKAQQFYDEFSDDDDSTIRTQMTSQVEGLKRKLDDLRAQTEKRASVLTGARTAATCIMANISDKLEACFKLIERQKQEMITAHTMAVKMLKAWNIGLGMGKEIDDMEDEDEDGGDGEDDED